MSEHLGYDKHDPAGRNTGNSRTRSPDQEAADRDRAARDRGAERSRRQLRTAAGEEAPTSPDVGGQDRDLADGQRLDDG